MSRIERSWVDVNRLGAPVTKSMIEVVAASSIDRVIAERDALQQRLNVADEQVSQKSWALLEVEAACDMAMAALDDDKRGQKLVKIIAAIRAKTSALKPAEGSTATTCTWSQDASALWNSTCGVTWGFMDGSPHSHGMRFCHRCGNALVVIDEGEGDE